MTNRLHKIVFLGLGFTSTTSILAIPVGGIFIKVFNVFFLLSFVLLVLSNAGKMKSTKLDQKFYMWMLLGILSSLFGIVFFIGVPDFQEAALSYIPKILLYTLFFVLLKRTRSNMFYSSYICDGLLYGCVFNLGWAIVDAIGYYSTGVSITNSLFASYLSAANIRYEQASLIFGGTIRASGINYDPANIGLFAPVVALYGLKKRSYLLYGLSVLSILASISHTAFLGIIMVTLYYLYTSKRKFVAILSFAVVVAGAVVLFTFFKSDSVAQMTEAFIERTEQKADGGEMQGARGDYWVNFIPAAISQPSALVIGTGYFTASYPYLKSGLTHHEIEPYDPEQTYFSMYFDIGLIGLLIFMSLLYGIFKVCKNNTNLNSRQYIFIQSGIIGSFVVFLGYHYTLYSVVMLVIIAGIILCDRKLYCKQN